MKQRTVPKGIRNRRTRTCSTCYKQLRNRKHRAQCKRRGSHKNYFWFCCLDCKRAWTGSRKAKPVEVACAYCGVLTAKPDYEIRRSKSGRFFCGYSCRSKYTQAKLRHNFRRSALELWLEPRLTKIYDEERVVFNDRKALSGLELDIFLPKRNLAIEISGYHHYNPIYGPAIFTKTQANDKRKAKQCIEVGISLHVIDVAWMTSPISEQDNERVLSQIRHIIGV